jgi:HAD superfamily hydrolase (TIGR01509 family)
MITAVLFDMDGLMFDTERLFGKLAGDVAHSLGYEITEEMILHTLGTSEKAADVYFSSLIPTYRPEAFWPAYRAAGNRYVEAHGAPEKPYLKETVEAFKQAGLRMAVASGSPTSEVVRNLASAGISDYFEALVPCDIGLPSKPAPDMFLRAAELLNVPINQCAVLEDSPNGLRAGRAAGAFTVMVPDMQPYTPELAPFCDAVCENLREAGRIILCR